MEEETQSNVFNSFSHPNGTTVFIPRTKRSQKQAFSDTTVYSLKLPKNCDLSKPLIFNVNSNQIAFVICERLSDSHSLTAATKLTYTSENNGNMFSQTELDTVDNNNYGHNFGTNANVLNPNSTASTVSTGTPNTTGLLTSDEPVTTAVSSMGHKYSSVTAMSSKFDNIGFVNDVLSGKSQSISKRSRGRPLNSYSPIKDIEETSLGFKCSHCGYLTQSRRQVLKHRRTAHKDLLSMKKLGDS